MAQTAPKPSIEWPVPQINDGHAALEDVSCLIERLLALMKHNIDEMQEAVIDRPVANEFQASWINNVWMIFRLADEKLQEVDKIVSAIVEAGVFMPASPVAKHTRMRRSRDFRAAIATLIAENASTDTGDEAFDRAGAALDTAMSCRVGSLEDFREKMEVLNRSGSSTMAAYVDQLFADLDALGARAHREFAA